MKLRLRSIESKETLKIEAPNPCTLRQLKQILSQNLPNSPSPASIRLSLNRKDELRSASPDGEDSLQLLGVASGDLVFFTIDSDLVQNDPPVSEQEVGMDSDSGNIHPFQEHEASQDMNAGDSLNEPKISELDGLKRKIDTATQLKESTDCMGMELDDGCDDSWNSSDGCSADVVEESFSVPGYLRKVFMDELDDDCVRNHKLTVVAIHAVFQESGFVGFDRNSNKQIGSFQFKNDWPSGGFQPSVSYTLPDIVTRNDGNESIDSVVLKFHSLGKFMSVYGSLENESRGHGTHFLKLNEDQLVPLLNVVWANCGVTESIGFDGGVSSTSLEKELFKFWRDVKDKLALPLLIGLCEKTGLELPPCFIRLPTDLKMKILELLPGVDVAKTSCVCSELQYLASTDDLWKLKFNEQFRNTRAEEYASWKKAFAVAWLREKARYAEERRIRAAAPRRTRHPNPFFVPRGPRMIGGPHDIWPVFGDDRLMRLHDPVNARKFSPPCRLGGQNNRQLI